ncbi:MAG: amidohydrolase family protein [Flavobacteriales bacterium]|nr:amidohydrolase family protein [Flavobacteriales bacterium]
MILDSNTHITRDGKWFHTIHDASLERLIHDVKLSGIDGAIVLPLPGTISNSEQHAMLQDQQQLISCSAFNPALYSSPYSAGEAFRKEFSNQKSTIVKFHHRFGKYHPHDERFMEVLRVNETLDTPMIIAVCGLLHDRNIREAVYMPGYFFNLAQRFFRTQILIMHGGGTQIMQVAEICRDLHHVFFDLSMTLSKYRNTSVSQDIAWLCAHYDRRMLWGSDFPETSPQQALEDFYATVGNIAEEKKKNILGDNIARLLGLI